MKVAYQGERFSNSEAAAVYFVNKYKIPEAGFCPLVNSGPVLDAILNREADLGVCALENSKGGFVEETKEALKKAGSRIRMIDRVTMPIHHCLFIRSEDDKNIHCVVSHTQALRQTRGFIGKRFPGARMQEEKDTALAARMLAEGAYPNDCAVICKKEAGEWYGLYLVAENIEDDTDNVTTFALYEADDTGFSNRIYK